MSHNSFGHLFRVTTWGESHGPAIGCVIDGCPAGVRLDAEDIQRALNRRKPGTSKYVTQRREADSVEILSGVFVDDAIMQSHGGQVTTGTPISLLIHNTDQRSKDYGDIKDSYRPGHADYTYDQKYGLRDYRGGGRSSARETAMRVAAGAVAQKILGSDIQISAYLTKLGASDVTPQTIDMAFANTNPFFCPDADVLPVWAQYLDAIRKSGSSCGAVVEVVASGVPAGWGSPVYAKLDAELAGALLGINAAKGVEIGAGFGAAMLSGEENADEMHITEGSVSFGSNNNGGVLGGISSGQDIVARVAFKPTSSILSEVASIDRQGNARQVRTVGRHDPCVALRAPPVVEAMVACVLADAKLRHYGQKAGM